MVKGDYGFIGPKSSPEGSFPRKTDHHYLRFCGGIFIFGDGIITPAISVLSAVEGLSIATPAFDRFIIPISIGILIALFAVQRHGSAVMGKFFGPITLIWFLSIGAIGISSIIQSPFVLALLSPHWAFLFVVNNPLISFFVMGAVVLTVTGGEALYADMGHFGILPIRLGWFLIVLPCLILNYAGQGALLLRDPTTITNPFYLLLLSASISDDYSCNSGRSNRFSSVNQRYIFHGEASNPTGIFTSLNNFAYI